MKKVMIYSIAVLIMFCLVGCTQGNKNPKEETISEYEYENIRDFYLSDDGAKEMARVAGVEGTQCELCAVYKDIATFKVSQNDQPSEFYTVKICSGDTYSMEIISHRTFEEFEGLCEFFPNTEDGYPEEAFNSIDVYEFIPKDITSAQKIYYVISEIGSGKYFTESEQINNLISSLSDMKVYPIERFLTNNEIYLEVESSGNVMEFYKSAEDEKPFCKIYLDMIYSESEESSKMYYPGDVSPVYLAYKSVKTGIGD